MSATGIIDHVVRPHVAQTEEKYLDNQSVSSAGTTYIPGQWSSGVDRVVTNVIRLFEARTMGEHCASMPIMAKNVVWDAPPFLLSRKGSVRVSAYLFKFIARQRFIPSLVQVRRVGMNSHLLEVAGTLMVYPRRSILLPATLLLPEHIPIRATLNIGVSGDLDSGVVELVAVKWHNLPALPNFMRAANGLAFGTVPHLLEPLWSYLTEFVGDDFYKRKREATFSSRHPDSKVPAFDVAKDAISDTANGVMDFGVDSVHNLWDGTSYLYNNFLEAVGFSLGRARAYTATAADLASNLASTTYNTAANIAGGAANVAAGTAAMTYDTASGVAGKAYETAADVAARTRETAAGLAQGAYDTTTAAAGTVYETGRQATGAAYETGRQTVEAGRETGRAVVDTASARAHQAGDDARRGYEMGKNKPVEVPIHTTRAPAGVSSY